MSEQWYLRREDKTVYGPSDLSELKAWAKNGRIGPNDDVSQDQETWQAAPMLKDLEMVWSLQMDDNLVFGPFNIYALIQLAEENHLSYATDTMHLSSGKHHSLGDVLLPLLYTERESLIERAQQEMRLELDEARAAAETLRHEVKAREEDLKTIDLQFQNKVKEQNQLTENAMNDHQSLLLEREQALTALQAVKKEMQSFSEQLKIKNEALLQLETQVQELQAEVSRRDAQIGDLRAAQTAPKSEAPSVLEPVQECSSPVSGESPEGMERLKDELANARTAIHHRDVEIGRLKKELGARPASLVSQAMAKNRATEEPAEDAGPTTAMPLHTAPGGISRETLKDSKKKSQAVANFKRQRIAAKKEASSKAVKGGSSIFSRRK